MINRVKRVAVFGASGSIGQAFCQKFASLPQLQCVYAYSRSKPAKVTSEKVSFRPIDILSEDSLAAAASEVEDKSLDIVVVATGLLHSKSTFAEKRLSQCDLENMSRVFSINTFAPLLIAKHFIPKLHTRKRSIFAVLSARVGSISDNRSGGWYSYRSSKAALNMELKCLAVERKRVAPEQIIVGLHPGTVDSRLSAPFQSNVDPEKLFTPQKSVSDLFEVLSSVAPEQSGQLLAWDGKIIEP